MRTSPQKIKLIVVIIVMAIFSMLVFLDPKTDYYYKTVGISNGGFLTEEVMISEVDQFSMKLGEFPLRRLNGELVAHPIIEIIKINGEVLGYYTKGIKNKYYDPILLPNEIEGRAFRILENGEVEEDTKYIGFTH